MHSIITQCQLPDFLLALDAKPSPRPRSPRPHSSPRATSRSSRSGTQKLRYAAYEPPPPAQPRHPNVASSASRSTPSSDSYDDLARTVTAGDLAIAAGSPELRALSSVRNPLVLLSHDDTIWRHSQPQPMQSPSASPSLKPESISLLVRTTKSINPSPCLSHHEQSPRADLISLDTPFIAEPEPGEVTAPEQSEQSDDFGNVWDTASAFSARGWYDGTLDAVVRRLQGLGFPRGLSVLPADQPPFEGGLGLCSYIALRGIGLIAAANHRGTEGLDSRRSRRSWTGGGEITREPRQR
jgi:AP-4 complex subunit epsilon-1